MGFHPLPYFFVNFVWIEVITGVIPPRWRQFDE